MFDLVILNAKIYDGTSAPFFWANVGIAAGKIQQVTRLPLCGRETLDAQGLVLCPGFIDAHGHMDSMLERDPLQRAKLEQGITTSIGGLCGGSEAPVRDAEGNMMAFSQYLDRLSQEPTGANLALMVGNGTLRAAAMGYQAGPPSPAQLVVMKSLLHDAMQAGALGISFGLVYPPSSYADLDEMAALCSVVAQYDGFAAFHLRNEGDFFYEAVEEAFETARRSGCRLILSHHKATREPNWGKTQVTLGMLDLAAAQGLEVYADAHPYTAVSAGLKAYIPQTLHSMGMEKLTEMGRSAGTRRELIDAVEQSLKSGTGHYKQSDPPRAYILASAAHPEYNGRRIVELAHEQGRSFAEVVIDTLCEDHMTTAGMHINIMNPDDVNRVLRHPRVMLCTDGASILPGIAVHPRVRGTFPRFLGRMCIRDGLLPVETAISKMTSLPARVYGFHSKGLIREGADADLVLFDPLELCDNATVSDSTALNSGLKYVLIAGKIVVKDNQANGRMCAALLRRHGAN